MLNTDAPLRKRFTELSDRAEQRRCAVFTDFLDLDEQRILRESGLPAVLSGGFEGAERVMARFGGEADDEFPFAWVVSSPRSQKFADALTHRDVLGALMSLGIRREMLGDILLAENVAYVLCKQEITAFIVENLVSIKHTAVRCSVTDTLPVHALPSPEPRSVVIASERLDALVASVFNLSRSEAQALFAGGKIFLNAREVSNPDAAPHPGDILSARGYGRFRYAGIERETKKGRLRANVEVY